MIAEDLYFGKPQDDAEFSLEGVIEDVKQALKISAGVFALGAVAFFIGFISVLGQNTALVVWFFMNALLIFRHFEEALDACGKGKMACFSPRADTQDGASADSDIVHSGRQYDIYSVPLPGFRSACNDEFCLRRKGRRA